MKGILDIETSGFSITKNGVCEIALIAVNDKLEVVDTFHTYIKPYQRDEGDELVSYKDDSMAVNGLTVEKLIAEGVNVVDVMFNLKYFIEQHNIQTIIGHNSNAFDLPRIEYLFNRFLIDFNVTDLRRVDTMKVLKDRIVLPSYSLGEVCKFFDIVIENQHTAVGDALATLELYRKLIDN